MASNAQEPGLPDGPPLPRFVFWLMLPGIVAPVLIFAFILFTRAAHDPQRCPFHELARHPAADGSTVLEEVRSCVPATEEHRYSLVRDGATRLLGERSFDKQAFGRGYRVTVELTANGELELLVHNDGHDDLLFREGTAREHDRGVSLGHRSARDRARAAAKGQ